MVGVSGLNGQNVKMTNKLELEYASMTIGFI